MLELTLVALGHHRAAMDHHDGMGAGERAIVVAHRVQEPVERALYVGRRRGLGPRGRGPRHPVGLGGERDQVRAAGAHVTALM